MNAKQQQRLRKSCVAILGAKTVQRGEFDRVCDQVLKPTLAAFATQAIYLGLHLTWQHGKPKAPPAIKLEITFKDQPRLSLPANSLGNRPHAASTDAPRRVDAALLADGARLCWMLEGVAVLPHWRPRMRTLTAEQLLDGLLDLIALLEPVDPTRPVDSQDETDAGPRRARRSVTTAG